MVLLALNLHGAPSLRNTPIIMESFSALKVLVFLFLLLLVTGHVTFPPVAVICETADVTSLYARTSCHQV